MQPPAEIEAWIQRIVAHGPGFADTQTTIKGWMLEEVQVMKND
jgi:hypothetical protein